MYPQFLVVDLLVSHSVVLMNSIKGLFGGTHKHDEKEQRQAGEFWLAAVLSVKERRVVLQIFSVLTNG